MPNEQLDIQVQSPPGKAELNHWPEENINQGGGGRGSSEDSRLKNADICSKQKKKPMEKAVTESPGK